MKDIKKFLIIIFIFQFLGCAVKYNLATNSFVSRKIITSRIDGYKIDSVPDADVLGWDALAKVTILSKVVFGGHGRPFDYPCQGITEISASAIDEARKKRKRFKLIGKVWRENGQVKASVAPEEVDLIHPLASVMGATNAVTITTDTLGDITVVGPGAGKRETGFSLLSDLIAIGG